VIEKNVQNITQMSKRTVNLLKRQIVAQKAPNSVIL